MSDTITEPTKKFNLLVDLGIITVPDNYNHDNRLALFGKQDRKKFWTFNDREITDQHFPNPSRILKPGDKLRVRVFKSVVDGESTTSEERMAFLAIQNAVHPSAQGASLVFEQKHDQFPEGDWWIESYDEPERLWNENLEVIADSQPDEESTEEDLRQRARKEEKPEYMGYMLARINSMKNHKGEHVFGWTTGSFHCIWSSAFLCFTEV